MYFVSDIDGTLLAQPGDRVIDGLPEALDRLQKCGVKIVLASGRTLHDVTLAAKRLRLDNYYAISSNGRIVTQMRGSQTVDTVYANYDIRLGIALANAGRKVVFQDIIGNWNGLRAKTTVVLRKTESDNECIYKVFNII